MWWSADTHNKVNKHITGKGRYWGALYLSSPFIRLIRPRLYIPSAFTFITVYFSGHFIDFTSFSVIFSMRILQLISMFSLVSLLRSGNFHKWRVINHMSACLTLLRMIKKSPLRKSPYRRLKATKRRGSRGQLSIRRSSASSRPVLSDRGDFLMNTPMNRYRNQSQHI